MSENEQPDSGPSGLDLAAGALFLTLALAVPLILGPFIVPEHGYLPLIAVLVFFWPQLIAMHVLFRRRRRIERRAPRR